MMTVFSGRFGPEVESPVQIGQKPGLSLPFLFQFVGKLTLRTRFNVKKLIVPKLLIENDGSLSCLPKPPMVNIENYIGIVHTVPHDAS